MVVGPKRRAMNPTEPASPKISGGKDKMAKKAASADMPVIR